MPNPFPQARAIREAIVTRNLAGTPAAPECYWGAVEALAGDWARHTGSSFVELPRVDLQDIVAFCDRITDKEGTNNA